MSKMTKSERITQLEQIAVDQARAFKIMADRLNLIEVEGKWIIHMTGIETPQLKQLDQSVFDGVFDWVKSAAVNPDGSAYLFSVGKDDFYDISEKYGFQITGRDKCKCIGLGYDASDWRNSLIERDTAKEPAEVDLSSELTGSDLARAMFERGDNYIMCVVGTIKEVVIIDTVQDGYFYSKGVRYLNPKPINNQGEPLTASEVGL